MFATTRWTLVLAASDCDGAVAMEALEQLCRAYWFPLYAYVRRRGESTGHGRESVRRGRRRRSRRAKGWEPVPGECWLATVATNHLVFRLHFSPDGSRLLAAGQMTSAKLWDLTKPGSPPVLFRSDRNVWDATLTSDGSTLVSATSRQPPAAETCCMPRCPVTLGRWLLSMNLTEGGLPTGTDRMELWGRW